MPQGDIRAKQQALAGHHWVSLFDFASGFYACPIAEESQQYTAFYIEGKGYFKWLRMPFGLTGAPTTFGQMTARCLGDLIGLILQLFADDGGIAGNEFKTKINHIRTFFERVRATDLSLSPQKTKLFMEEIIFAGERVGRHGIRPDLTKLAAVVNWKVPTELLNLGAFTGLTGYFRSLTKNYAKIASPLTDLVRGSGAPRFSGKGAYRKVMKSSSLIRKWTPELNDAFIKLKIALTTQPVLRGPRYDQTPFTVTTNGCKRGYGGVATQPFTTKLPNGSSVTRMHPIAFCSKRTSASEEKYKPFLSEMAALKFSLDQFSSMIYGFPVKIETDCQALRDMMLSKKLNSTHARWRETILSHHIVGVAYRPGRTNQAADGLSRMYEGVAECVGDGHEWTVNKDWEPQAGLIHDIFKVSSLKVILEDTCNVLGVTPSTDIKALRTKFKDKKLYLQVIDSIFELDHGTNGKREGRNIEQESTW